MQPTKSSNRSIVTRNQLVRSRSRARFTLPASFVTQVIVEHQRTAGQPVLMRPARNIAIDSYRAGAAITTRRAPAGLHHTKAV